MSLEESLQHLDCRAAQFQTMVAHDYLPADLVLPNFHPPVLRFEVVLAVFFSVSAIIIFVVYSLLGMFFFFLRRGLFTSILEQLAGVIFGKISTGTG